MEHQIDDACGSLRFNLSTLQTKVGHLDGLCHWEMYMVVALSECLEVPGCKNLLHWSDNYIAVVKSCITFLLSYQFSDYQLDICGYIPMSWSFSGPKHSDIHNIFILQPIIYA